MTDKRHEDESRPPGKIPEFASVQEESLFWDTHDFTDFLDETTPVTINYHGSIGETFSGPLDSPELDALIKHAKEEGVSVPDLVRLWVKEHLAKKSA